MMPIFLTTDDVESLEYELIPTSARVKLTRLLGRSVNQLPIDEPETHFHIRFLNRVINKANNLVERPIYVLESDDWGHYSAAEIAWHESEFEVCIRRLDAAQFIEFLADVVEENLLELDVANDLLVEADSSAKLRKGQSGRISVSIAPLAGNVALDPEANPNLRTLVSRMDAALKRGDHADALGNSAQAIEVISKEAMGTPSVANETFGSYFEGYKNKTGLPAEVVDWMLEIYKRRNTEPLASHGQLEPPQISGEETALIVEMTKAFIRYERWSATHNVTATP